MTMSAFGVEHPGAEISKKAKQQPPSAGRLASGAVFPGWHGAIAGKRGKARKLKAAGVELGGAMVVPYVGGGLGTLVAHDQGWLKPQKRR
jgi:hypothetical protein